MLNGNFMCTLLWEERNGRFSGFAAQGQAAALNWWGSGCADARRQQGSAC